MNPLDTTKFGPMIAQAARDAIKDSTALELSEADVWKLFNRKLESISDDIPKTGGYGLTFKGDITELPVFRKHAGEPNGFEYGEPVYLRVFNTVEDRAAFKAKMLEFLKPFTNPDIRFTEHEGPHCLKRPVAFVKLKWQGKEYEVRKEYSYGYPLHVVVFDWEENNFSCDCNRANWIERFHPGTTGAYAGDGKPCTDGEIEVTSFAIALTDGPVDHGAPYQTH